MSANGPPPESNLELILDWISAMRTADLDAIAELLDPQVVWHGVPGDLVCVGRAAVIDALREQVPVHLEADAIELISAPGQVVMGTRSEHLPQPPGVQLRGQIHNVFERRGGRFTAIRDFAARDGALRSAGAERQARWT
jgi:ketosteroid isomerase-like protein